MRQVSIEGIILKKRALGEHDQYITLYCSEFGKIEAIAKGSRKSGSQFTGHLEIPNICRFQLYQSNRNNIIIECKIVTSFRRLYQSYNKALVAMLLIELFEKSLSFYQAEKEFLPLLHETLSYLDENHNIFVCVESFKLKLLEFLGIFPNLSACSICQKKWQIEEIFLDHDKRVFCDSCIKSPFGYQKISSKIIEFMDILKSQSLKEIAITGLKIEDKKILYDLSRHFLQIYLQQEIKSEKVLRACVVKAINQN